MDNDVEASLIGEKDIVVTVDDESSIGDLPMSETLDAALSNGVESEGRISFGGIWWNASWAHDWDLYDDYEHWKYDDDIIMESEDLKKEDPEEEDEEDSEEENPEGKDSNNDSKEESSTGSNINP